MCVFLYKFHIFCLVAEKIEPERKKKKKKKKEKGRYLKLVVLASENLANFSGDKENRREI